MIKKNVNIMNVLDTDFKSKLKLLLIKDEQLDEQINQTVSRIIKEVCKSGDKALLQMVTKFDGINASKTNDLKIDKSILKSSYDKLPKNEKEALNFAAIRIKNFHQKQIPLNLNYEDKLNVKLGMLYNPIESAGFYVPGGKAIYPSSVLMNAIPALIAGVKRRIMVSPISCLNKSSIVLAAAYISEVTDFYCMGGAHSIAALAYGTETIERVDKIVGPGNAYVAEAKRQVFGKVGIDSIAGPSEVLIVCDKLASPDHVAIDLLSQAEHDENAQAILITNCKDHATKIEKAVDKFLKEK